MSDDRDHRLVEAIYGEGRAAPGDEAEAARLKAFREGLAARLDQVRPPAALRERLVAEARARVRARRSPWAVWALRLAPVATVVLVVGVWLTVQPRFDQVETATPEQTAARVAAEWALSQAPAEVAPRAQADAPPSATLPPPSATLQPPSATLPPLSAAKAQPSAAEVAAADATEEETARKPGPAKPEGSKATGPREQRERLAKELERLSTLTAATGDTRFVHVVGSGAGLGSTGEPGRRGVGGTSGGSGYGRLGTGKGAVASGDLAGARPSDGKDERAAVSLPAPSAKAKASSHDAGLLAGDDPASVTYRQAPRRDEAPGEEQAVESEPRDVPETVRAAASPAAAPEPTVTADLDDTAAEVEKKVATEAPAAPKPAAQGWSVPPVAARPDPELSCRSLEQALARATTTAQRVERTLQVAECRKRAGAPGLAKKLLEDLLDDTTLTTSERERIADALRGL